MCGIAGSFGNLFGTDSDAISRRIVQKIHYRGPDGNGTAHFENGFFVHLRLSIIDTSSGGTQPKWSADGRYCITYNGEIYNYRELKAELATLGHGFTTESDTEVLLKVWEAWGAEGLNRCIGMFAFAVYDKLRGEVHLARDPYGIKPLYIAETGSGIRFGSTYAVLDCFPDCPRHADAARAFEFVRYGILNMGNATLVHGVRSLAAGSVESWDISGDSPRLIRRFLLRVPRYSVRPDPPNFEQAAEELREAFMLSVRLHLRSDVPIGFALSGGIDSSAIACAARMLEPDADLQTFTYAAEEDAIDESGWAKLVADHTKSRPHIVRIKSSSAISALDDVVRTHGTPTAGMSTQAQIAVFQAAHEAGIKVMLDGQGADETFAGYAGSHIGSALAGYIRHRDYANAIRTYSAAMRVPRMRPLTVIGPALECLLPSRFRRLARQGVGREHLPDWVSQQWVESRSGRAINHLGPATAVVGKDVLAERLESDLTRVILPDLLSYEDRNSMRWSVESRVPFLAAPITDLAFSVPSSYHIGPQAETKRLLRAALKGILPDEIRTRLDKVGFEVPQSTWLWAEYSRIDAMLRSETARAIKLFDHSRMIARWEAIDSPRHPDFKYVWRWMGLIAWSRAFEIDWT